MKVYICPDCHSTEPFTHATGCRAAGRASASSLETRLASIEKRLDALEKAEMVVPYALAVACRELRDEETAKGGTV